MSHEAASLIGQRRQSTAWLLAALSLAALFGVICLLVVNGSAQSFDRWGLLALRLPANDAAPFGPAWFQETARDFTALGSNGVLMVLVLIGSALLAVGSGAIPSIYLLASFSGALVLNTLAKHIANRPRPNLVSHLVPTFTTSFPSSHATVTAAVLISIVVLINGPNSSPRLKLVAVLAALVILTLVGLSRVYLGVHWPTDIVAGWMLGGCWACLCSGYLVTIWFTTDTLKT